jgi:hypothetical protein
LARRFRACTGVCDGVTLPESDSGWRLSRWRDIASNEVTQLA